jgi:uncharacterized lipoprotein YmbA
MTRSTLFLLAALLVAGCEAADQPRYLIDPAPPAQKLWVAAATIEVREVSLPAYASDPEILAEAEDGALYAMDGSLWADDPVQGVTSALVGVLSRNTTATVAAEPWPLTEPAQVRLEVRVTEAYARADGVYVLSGQFAVASPDEVVRELVRGFEIRAPIPGEGSGAIASAQSAAITELGSMVASALR